MTDLEKKLIEHTSHVPKPTNPLNERNERKRETKIKPESLWVAVHVRYLEMPYCFLIIFPTKSFPGCMET